MTRLVSCCSVGLLALSLVGCGSVSAVDVDGGADALRIQGAAGAAGSSAGADGQAGTSGAAGASAGAAGSATAGTAGTAGAGGTGAAGATGGGVSAVACPADWAVQRGCAAPVQGAPCDVCYDAAGAPLRCATSAVATARVFCVPDCASCY